MSNERKLHRKKEIISPDEAKDFVLVNLVPQIRDIFASSLISSTFTINSKQGVDLVTTVDLEIDQLIKCSILKRFPQSVFLTGTRDGGRKN